MALTPSISQLSLFFLITLVLLAQLADCRKLEILSLPNNQFRGKVSVKLSSLIRLRVLDLSSNKFTWNLRFLKHFPSLKLSLAENVFSGKVPTFLKHFQNLWFVNISANSFFEDLMPEIKDHSSSKLARKTIIPKRYIFAENFTCPNKTSEVASSISKDLNVTSVKPPSPVAPTHEHKKNKDFGVWILVSLAGVLPGSFVLIYGIFFKPLTCFIKQGGKDTSLTIFSPMIQTAEDLAFLNKEDGLAFSQIIGRGGCGEVYKAELSNRKMIAVKKIIQPLRDAAELTVEDSRPLNKKMRQIKSEIQTAGQIRHRNLLPLLAHVPRPDCHYLVYEYMKNGSLQDVLLQVAEGKREFDWLSRHRIALGIAAGLEYLHMNQTLPIIHRDLKPANILLDDHMEARITDFGLAKVTLETYTHVTTSNVAGTVGYIAPEYYQTLKVTNKCDIYSLGVLLFVLVIGKLPSDKFFQNTAEINPVKWMRNVMSSEDPKRAIDPKLLGNGYEEQMLLVLKIACFCTLENPKERPNSKDVRLMLSQIKH